MQITAEGIGIVVFTAVMVAIGFYFSKKNSGTSDEFFLSGRNNSVWLIVAGHVMGWVGAGTLVGVYGAAYTGGVAAGIWYPIGFTASFFIFGPIMAKRVKRLGDARHVTTLTEIMRRRFSSSVGGVYLTFETVQLMAYVVGQYMAIAIILDMALGISYAPACILAGVIVLVYVALGGLTGSLAVTLLQMGITIVGLLLAVFTGLKMQGGFTNMMANLPVGWNANIFAGQSIAGVLNGFLPTFLASFIYGTMYIRCYSAKDQKTSANACYISGVVAALIIGLSIIGVYVTVTCVPGLASGDYALLELFRKILPFGAALFAAAIVAACMSTAAESVISMSAVFTNDVLKGIMKLKLSDRQTVLSGRVAMCAVTLIACSIAIFMSSVLSLMYYASTIIAAFVPSYLISLWWNRVNHQGIMAGMIGGGATAVLWDFIPGASSIISSLYAGIIISIVAMLIVTFIFPAPDKKKLFFIQPFQTPNYEQEYKEEVV